MFFLQYVKHINPLSFQTRFPKKWINIQGVSGYFTAPNTAKTISCKTSNSTVGYLSRESKHEWHKEVRSYHAHSNIQINVQGRKHPGRCAFAEPELRWHFKELLPIQHPGTKSPNSPCRFFYPRCQPSPLVAYAVPYKCCNVLIIIIERQFSIHNITINPADKNQIWLPLQLLTSNVL